MYAFLIDSLLFLSSESIKATASFTTLSDSTDFAADSSRILAVSETAELSVERFIIIPSSLSRKKFRLEIKTAISSCIETSMRFVISPVSARFVTSSEVAARRFFISLRTIRINPTHSAATRIRHLIPRNKYSCIRFAPDAILSP